MSNLVKDNMLYLYSKYKQWRIKDLQARVEMFERHEKEFKKMLAKADRERGSTLLNSSIVPTWQAEHSPVIEEANLDNFMRWLSGEEQDSE